MKYKVTCRKFNDDKEYTLLLPISEQLKLIEAKLSLELNKSGTFTFEIAVTHPYYDKIIKMGCEITIYQNDKIIYIGRPISEDIDFYRTKTVVCEGILGYLLDSIQIPPYNYNGTVEEVFNKVIDVHNSMVDDFKQFKVGTVDVQDGDTSNDDNIIERWSLDDYINTLQFINEKLIGTIGGYVSVDYDTRTINYLTSSGKESGQVIRFGENLLDLTQYINSDDLATVIIPLGAKQPEHTTLANRRLIIVPPAHLYDYTFNDICIFDEDSIKVFGKITKTVDFENVNHYRRLRTKGESYLKECCNLGLTIELTAVDLNCINSDISAFVLGEKIRVISQPHEVDSNFLLSQMEIDLCNCANSKITLGKTIPSLTSDMSNFQNKMMLKVNNKKDIVENSQVQSVMAVGQNSDLQTQIQELENRIAALEAERGETNVNN